ncbi:hypothetical protein CMI37_19365 [Candidatus Pacearchaeota archaeon]|nr:hypothetical protein [Candidatus Pacearchaeota archaeon]|tara:strand:+ start:2234 stop:2854 length:621 start_codon:yes stop_codon:yes gene_type:complete
MVDILDTNIFIISIYAPLYVRAVNKFLTNQQDPIPYSLHNEISNQSLILLINFQKISHELKKGISPDKIQELVDLNNSYDNVYSFLKLKSNNFKNIKKLLEVIDLGIQRLITIDTWVETAKFYPENKIKERKILKKYSSSLTKLRRLPELHSEDLRILAILNHIYKKAQKSVNFVTRDQNSIIVRKRDIESEFPFVRLIKISEYLV